MKKTKLFHYGKSQAVRLPKEFRFEGKEVCISKRGDEVILSSIKNMRKSWGRFFESLEMFSDDVCLERNQPTDEDKREWFEVSTNLKDWT
jgi:antitoxin VapB